jgi:hypothetical protein
MSWRDAFLHPRRNQERSRPAKTPARAVGLEMFTASEPPRDADGLGLHADPDETMYAEMAVMAARAAKRAREEELDNDRVAMMVPRHRLECRRMRWEAVNAVKLSGMSPRRIEQEYDAFRLAEWEQQNAERIAQMGPGERQESFRLEELLTRYRAGLPARDAEEREAYQEWRQLDADVVNAYQEDATIPGPRSGGAVGELSPESPAAEMSPGTVSALPGPAGAGSGLEDGPMSRPARDSAAQRDSVGVDAESLLMIRPGDPGAPGQVRPAGGGVPRSPVPG